MHTQLGTLTDTAGDVHRHSWGCAQAQACTHPHACTHPCTHGPRLAHPRVSPDAPRARPRSPAPSRATPRHRLAAAVPVSMAMSPLPEDEVRSPTRWRGADSSRAGPSCPCRPQMHPPGSAHLMHPAVLPSQGSCRAASPPSTEPCPASGTCPMALPSPTQPPRAPQACQTPPPDAPPWAVQL